MYKRDTHHVDKDCAKGSGSLSKRETAGRGNREKIAYSRHTHTHKKEVHVTAGVLSSYRTGERKYNDERDTGGRESPIPNNALNSTHLPLRHA